MGLRVGPPDQLKFVSCNGDLVVLPKEDDAVSVKLFSNNILAGDIPSSALTII